MTPEPDCNCEQALAMKAELKQLRAEVAKLEGRVASADSELRSAMDRIIQLTDERDALRELAGELLERGGHESNGPTCPVENIYLKPGTPCDCGWDDLLARAAALGVG